MFLSKINMRTYFFWFKCEKFNVIDNKISIVSFVCVLLQEVVQLEVLCKQLYESQDASRRTEAEKALVTFQNASDR